MAKSILPIRQIVSIEGVKNFIGCLFRRCYIYEDVADDGVINMHVAVGTTNKVHMSIYGSAGGDAIFRIYETPTGVAGGTVLPATNFNRDSSNTADIVIKRGVTFTTEGDFLCAEYAFGGFGPLAGGAPSEQLGKEWILKSGGEYLITGTNVSGGVKDLFIVLEWYEEECC